VTDSEEVMDSEELLAKRKRSNARYIEKFRANNGKTGVEYETLLLHHTGRKSGVTHVTPAAYHLVSGNRYVLYAANWGSLTDPDWCQNLRANPETTVELGFETINVTAREAEGPEREELRQMILADPVLGEHRAEFDRSAGRPIPIVVLTPRNKVADA
jgi:deazaflavin-dependent oxidoreductase (nitroreductase family)